MRIRFSQFQILRNARDSLASHKAVRILLALYCAPKARKVSMYCSRKQRHGGPSEKKVKEASLRTRNQ
jgi:hypothetical protein